MVPTEGLMDQVTPVFVVQPTLEMNCWVWDAARMTCPGLTYTLIERELLPIGVAAQTVGRPQKAVRMIAKECGRRVLFITLRR